MTVIGFPYRSPEPARTPDELRRMKMSPDPRCAITMRKDERERRYTIAPDAPGYWVGEIWYGRAQHSRKRVAGVHDARMLAMQFMRELRDLVADGWATGNPLES